MLASEWVFGDALQYRKMPFTGPDPKGTFSLSLWARRRAQEKSSFTVFNAISHMHTT